MVNNWISQTRQPSPGKFNLGIPHSPVAEARVERINVRVLKALVGSIAYASGQRAKLGELPIQIRIRLVEAILIRERDGCKERIERNLCAVDAVVAPCQMRRPSLIGEPANFNLLRAQVLLIDRIISHRIR